VGEDPETDHSPANGECRRHSPRIVLDQVPNYFKCITRKGGFVPAEEDREEDARNAVWPRTLSYHWCGEYLRIRDPKWDSPLDLSHTSVRLKKVLHRITNDDYDPRNIGTAAELADLSRSEFMLYRGSGATTAKEAADLLRRYGLAFKGEVADAQ
jgi:hypothetical protein